MLLSICEVILSLHFGRIFLTNVYRGSVAFMASREQLCQILSKSKAGPTTVDEEGNTHESVVADVDAITALERCKFFLHIMLSA